MLGDTHFTGRGGFYFWIGVVEDRQDPDMLGRVRVRILGNDTKDKAYIKSVQLQWAYPVQDVTSAARNGLGQTPMGPFPGTWVFGFYMDGEDMQSPYILGTLAGIPQNAPQPTVGFNDPRDVETAETLAEAPRKIQSRSYPFDGSGASLTDEPKAVPYPRVTHPLGCVVKESDINRIARNQLIAQTIIGLMQTVMLDTGVPIAFGGSWSEAPPWYDGVYPYVHVYESESGHLRIIDDTPDTEGTLEWDRTGTNCQTQTDGSEVHKIVMDNYTIVLRNNYIHIMGTQDERVDHEDNLSVGGRLNVEVQGNINVLTHSGIYIQSAGDTNVTVGGDANLSVGGDANISVGGSVRLGAGGSVNIKGATAVNIQSSANINLVAAKDVNICAGGVFAVDAALIELNSGAAVCTPAAAPATAIPPKQ